VAIFLSGVDPSITEAKWSKLFAMATQAEVTSGLEVTPTSTARQVSIAVGDAVAAGVLAESNAVELRTLAANATGNSRIDIVALQINWSGTQTTGGTIVVVQGSPASTPAAPALTQTPGVLWQVALARVLVRPNAGVLTSGDLLTAAPGGNKQLKVYRSTPDIGSSIAGSAVTPKTIGTINVPDPGWQWRPRIYASVRFVNLTSGFGRIDATLDGAELGEEAAGRSTTGNDMPARLHYIGNARTGQCTVRLRMLPGGSPSGSLVTASAFAAFTVEVTPV
jgi:hypothetical protein